MPRSPSRDLADRFDGHRDYFSRRDGVRRWKYALAGVLLIATLGWAAFDRLAPAGAAFSHTHGTLAGPHAAMDSNCEACHAPSSASDFGVKAAFVGTGERWQKFSCGKCHNETGPVHHAAADFKGMRSDCGSCHHDHQGRLNPLSKLTDAHCTNCHADLPAYHAKGERNYEAKVTNFVTAHPEFRVLKEEAEGKPPARTLKFSHSLHMTPGLTYTPGARGAWTLDRLPTADRDRYRKSGQGDADAVSLDCASCHKLDSGTGGKGFEAERAALAGEPVRSVLPPRAEGAYYLPVNFDAHCKACHPVQAPANVTVNDVILPAFDLPHRVQPDRLADVLEGEYARRLAEQKPALKRPPGPGGRLDGKPEGDVPLFRDELDRLTRSAFEQLLAAAPLAAVAGGTSGPALSGGYSCGKCHDVTGEKAMARIAPVPDRTVWLAHAKFDHAAHRGVSCAGCHPGTGPGTGPDGTTVARGEKEPVQILGVESCRACHAPAGTPTHESLGPVMSGGGVRHACTDCHRYHNGDAPLQGRGAAARDPEKPQTVRDFLRGGVP